MGEARGSHCMPLARAKSATTRRIFSVAARAAKSGKGQCHGTPHARAAKEVDRQPVAFQDLEHPRVRQPGSRAHAHGHAHLPAAKPPHEVVERRLARPRPVVARCRSVDLVARHRVAPALQCRRLGERTRPPDDGGGVRIREAAQIVCGDQQRVIGIEVRQQRRAAGRAATEQQHRVAWPNVPPAANALRAACRVVARLVVLGAGRVVLQAPGKRRQQDRVAFLPGRHQHDARPRRRRTARPLAKAQPRQGRDVAEERDLLRHRLEEDGGREDPGSCIALGDDVGRDRIAGQRRQLAEALGRQKQQPPATPGQLDAHSAVDQPEQLGRRLAGAQDDVARFEATRLQVSFERGERLGRHAGEQRVQGERRRHRARPGTTAYRRVTFSTGWAISAASTPSGRNPQPPATASASARSVRRLQRGGGSASMAVSMPPCSCRGTLDGASPQPAHKEHMLVSAGGLLPWPQALVGGGLIRPVDG